MYMFQSEFADAAIKAYQEDPWTTDSDPSDDDCNIGAPYVSRKERGIMKEGGEIEITDRVRRKPTDEFMEGGS